MYKPWAKYYVAYKKLKKLINKANDPRKSQGGREKLKKEFFEKCFKDIKNSEEFYKKTVSKLLSSYNKYVTKYQKSHGHTKNLAGLVKDLQSNITLLEKLEEFCILNGEGFRKIVKKWDKRIDDCELEGFMIQVREHSFYAHNSLNWLKQHTTDLFDQIDLEIRGPGHKTLEGGNIGVMIKHNSQTYIIPMSPLNLPAAHLDAVPIALSGTVDSCLILDQECDMTKADRDFHDFLLEPESDDEREGMGWEEGQMARLPKEGEGARCVWEGKKFSSMFESKADQKPPQKTMLRIFEDLRMHEGELATPSTSGSRTSLSILDVLKSSTPICAPSGGSDDPSPAMPVLSLS